MEIIEIEHPREQDLKPIIDAVMDYGLSQVGHIAPIQKAFHLKFNGHVIGGATGRLHLAKFYLDHLWVHEKYRNQGHGTNIHNAIIDLANRHKCKAIYLQTLNSKAVKFYINLGYKIITTVPHYVEGFDLYHMAYYFYSE